MASSSALTLALVLQRSRTRSDMPASSGAGTAHAAGGGICTPCTAGLINAAVVGPRPASACAHTLRRPCKCCPQTGDCRRGPGQRPLGDRLQQARSHIFTQCFATPCRGIRLPTACLPLSLSNAIPRGTKRSRENSSAHPAFPAKAFRSFCVGFSPARHTACLRHDRTASERPIATNRQRWPQSRPPRK